MFLHFVFFVFDSNNPPALAYRLLPKIDGRVSPPASFHFRVDDPVLLGPYSAAATRAADLIRCFAHQYLSSRRRSSSGSALPGALLP